MALVTLQEVRDEGYTNPPFTDARVNVAIERVTQYIEKLTNNFFDVRTLTLNLDGNGAAFLPLPPVVSITSVTIDGELIDADEYEVYNRHLFGLTQLPNDQSNPKVQFKRERQYWRRRRPVTADYLRKFTKGYQNVEVVGKFGFRDYNSSEPDPANPEGSVPSSVKVAALLLIRRFLEEGDSPFSRDAWKGHHTVERQTRNQKERYGGVMMTGKVFGSLSGDLEIDQLLGPYVRAGGVSIV